MTEKRPSRPPVHTEVRAWITVGIVLMVNLVGGVWWAATLSAEVRALREQNARMETLIFNQSSSFYSAAEARRDLAAIQAQLQDHETRLRHVEKMR